MATQRYISTSFWDDDYIHKLDPSEKLMYLYFMTNPLTNIAGVYKLSVSRISYDTGFNENTIGHIMSKFEAAGKAFRIGEYIALPSWPKHQKWEVRSKIEEGIVACLLVLPKECLVKLVKIGYKYDLTAVFDTLSIPYPYEPNYSDIDSDSDINPDIDSDYNTTSEIPTVPPKSENTCSSESYLLADLLSELHTQNIDKGYRNCTPQQNQRWAEDIDKLNRIDGRSFPDIEKAIRWIKTPGCFWAPNIMSGKKLREKFPTVWAQMSRPTQNKPLKVNERTTFLDMED